MSVRVLRSSLALLCFASAALILSACEEAPGSQENDATQTSYVDLGDFVSSDADLTRWIEIRRGLDDEFDQICGDTFCGGDFSNIYSLGFTCSVSSKQGRMRECLWTFAASEELVNGATGDIVSTVPFYECRMRPTSTVRHFLPAFGEDDFMQAQLPGLTGTVHEQLIECFEPSPDFEPLPEPVGGPFADAADNLTTDAEIDAWYSMVIGLRQSFDEICGDSFCEGEYTNLTPLRFRCSMNVDSGRLDTCAWVFAASNNERSKKGIHSVDKASYVCTFPVDATPAELSAVLDPQAEGEDVLDRTLPGSTRTLNDVLIDCL